MRKLNVFLTLLIVASLSALAQDNTKYSRSSLHVMMIEDPAMEKGEIITNTFRSMDFPEKYDNHLLKERYANIIGELSDMTKAGIPGFKLKGIEGKIDAYFKEKRIANQLVGKWFNRDASGVMNIDLIKKRGLYNATEDDASDAAMLQKGFAALERSGLELIGNTFVVLEYFEFIDNEKWAKPVYEASKAAINKQDIPDLAKKLALKAAEAVYNKAEGYNVWTHAYLYQLEWNDSIQQIFKNRCWIGDNNKDKLSEEERKQRIQAFENPDMFNLKFVGKAKAFTLISQLNTKRSDSEVIQEATVRSVNKVYVNLQRKYDVFKTKTPFYEFAKKGKVCNAKIGMKEGLTGGEKFDVLVPKYSSKGGTKYAKKGTVKVDKKAIWDNRYYVTRPPELDEKDAIQATNFKGCKKGWDELILLLRQQK
ncbi:MAG: hypothetical protein CMD16_02360 [Flavobacteriales bacterium]|nr:hypothetical protein [Flavobacteriales bacterium]|tara:strand:- start:17633 stop:18901 length:1269 start_codon:yes stop_codon:yes gene_type:complete